VEKYQPPLLDLDIEGLVAAAQYPGQKQACGNLQGIAKGIQDASVAVVALQDAAIENVRLNPDGSPTSDADDASHQQGERIARRGEKRRVDDPHGPHGVGKPRQRP